MEYDDIVSVERETAFGSDTATYTFNCGCATPPKISRRCRSPQEINRSCLTPPEIHRGGRTLPKIYRRCRTLPEINRGCPSPPETEQRAKDEGVYEQLNSSDNKPTVQDGTAKRININLALVVVLYVITIAWLIVLTIVFFLPKEQECPKPEGTGRQCTGSLEEVSLCNKQQCIGTDGEWSSWQNWSSCSESCEGGMMSRNRVCSNPKPEGTGRQCTGSFVEVSLCNKQPCPGSDGGWSVWESWGTCSDSCGGGVRSRSRSCTNPSPSLTGRSCTGDTMDVSTCNRTACSEYNVAFTVYDLNTTPTSYTTLKFRRMYLNNGNAYNTTTGKFMCNVPGVYHFVVTLTKAFKDIGYVQAYLRINTSSKFKLLYDLDDDDSNNVGTSIMTGAVSFHLSQNDVVYVYGVPNDFFTCSFCSYFTGFLITPDQ